MLGPAGAPPAFPNNLLGDFGAGSMTCFAGVLLALLERGRTGRGKIVDAAMVRAVARVFVREEGKKARELGRTTARRAAWLRVPTKALSLVVSLARGPPREP